jgi:hypothetical protein
MFITRKYIPRRKFLRGIMGASVALPLLDAMVPALTAQSKTAAKPQLRFGAVYFPNGTVAGPTAPEMWHPKGVGADFEFTTPIKPFEPFRDQITVISGLARQGQSGSHLMASAMWLNSTPPASHDTSNFRQDTTIDQRIATRIGQDTPFPSLELATEDMSAATGACDGGYSCIYQHTLAWRTPTTPLPTENNPRVLFERIVGAPGTVEERLARFEDHRSILDSVMQDAFKLKGVLGTRDRVRLDEYLENIREIERQIQNASAKAKEQVSGNAYMPDAPAGIPDSYDEHAKLLFDLQALAFQGDITRVFTFLLVYEGTDMAYPACGVLDGDHTCSHHNNDPANMARRLKINAYHSSLMAYFLEKLRSTPDGNGTLLDHSLLLFGGGMGNGNIHDHTNLPLLVAGAKRFGVKGGRHVSHTTETPMANLLLALGDKAGLEIPSLANSNGRVDL